MKISEFSRSDKGKLAAVCAVLIAMLALGIALVSCSGDVSAEGIGVIIAAEMLRRSRLRCYGVPRCAATR